MGVYIRGMTMDDLRIHLRGDDLEYLIAVGHATDVTDHGELIDRDELMKHGVYMPMPGGNLPLVYMSYVKGAKAVIPAERSDEWEFTSKT